MKRWLSALLVFVLALSMVPAWAETVSGEGTPAVEPKMTHTDKRIQAYLNYLRDLFDEGTKITQVGLADINKDKLPELFYTVQDSGETTLAVCGYETGDVFEFDLSEDAMGAKPDTLTLKRYQYKNTYEHCWAIRGTTTKPDSDKRYGTFCYILTRSGSSLDLEPKFLRTWKKGGAAVRYYVDGAETTATVYDNERYSFFNELYQQAPTTTYKNQGIMKKVSTQKWRVIRDALDSASIAWKNLWPFTD